MHAVERFYPQALEPTPGTEKVPLPRNRNVAEDLYRRAQQPGLPSDKEHWRTGAHFGAAFARRSGSLSSVAPAPSTAVLHRSDGICLLEGTVARGPPSHDLLSCTARAVMRASLNSCWPPMEVLHASLPSSCQTDATAAAAPAVLCGLPPRHRFHCHHAVPSTLPHHPSDEDVELYRGSCAAAAAEKAVAEDDMEAGEISDAEEATDGTVQQEASPPAAVAPVNLSILPHSPATATAVAAAICRGLFQHSLPRQQRFLPLPRAVASEDGCPGCGFSSMTDPGPPPHILAFHAEAIVAQVLRWDAPPGSGQGLDFEHRGVVYHMVRARTTLSLLQANVCSTRWHPPLLAHKCHALWLQA
jgi:hypothetical protein